MTLTDHLRPDEEVKEEFGDEYATDRRIIKHHSGAFSEKVSDIHYDHISSVNAVRKTHWKIVGLGVLILLAFFVQESTPLLISGILVTLFGLLYRTGHYRVRGDGGENMVIAKHRYLSGLPSRKKGKADDFVQTIRRGTVRTEDD